ncbi:hypothetical protein HOP50_15g73800 [Chloropicon primus]|nr:hypothetical protein HOP50_15g73800 [Chloropicon primus]
MTKAKMKVVGAVALLACLAVATAAPADNATESCLTMAAKLNERYAVGSSRFNTSATGQEARDELREWMTSNGILLSMCNPQGYPDVYGPCTDEFPMDHLAASWVGLTDRARDLVEADTFSPFPVYVAAVGVIYDPAFEQVQVHCSSPTDMSSSGRQEDEDGNPGCGPIRNSALYGQDSLFRKIQEHFSATNATTTNATVEYAAADALKQYYKAVSGWDQMNWKAGEDFAEGPFNKTCRTLDGGDTPLNWPAVTPVDPSMAACRAFIADPKNIVSAGKFGSFGVINEVGSWDINSTVIREGLGHEYCIDDDVDPCVAEGFCSGRPLDWMGACTWKPEDFMSSIDAQHEISTMKSPSVDGPSIGLWNEISIPVEANTPQGDADGAEDNPFPSDYGEYARYSAQKLAEGYYGGVPVITVTPTKENALAGKIFGC